MTYLLLIIHTVYDNIQQYFTNLLVYKSLLAYNNRIIMIIVEYYV